MSSRMPNRGAALAVAAGGVFLGHWATYALVSPGPQTRRILLAQTGHAYLGVADQFALAITLVALAVVFLGRLAGGGDGHPSALRLLPRLASFQVSAFVAMEIAERISTGASVGNLFHGLILPVGCVVQVLVAGLGALAIGWMLRVAEIAAAAFGAFPVLPRLSFARLASPARVVPVRVPVATSRGRGPPILF